MSKTAVLRTSFFLILILGLFPLYSQEEESSKFGFGLGLELGVESFIEDDGAEVTYQRVGLAPVFTFGKFGISLDLSLHVASTGDSGSPLRIREEDWVPSGDRTFLDVYLPKINYIRYGFKGDPLYVKLGSINNASLGTGFIMGGYSNMLYQPQQKFFGLSFDLDGTLFGFPYVGLESFAGNLAKMDVMGMRLYGRPLVWSEIPILRNMELGVTAAGDRAPDARRGYFDALSGLPGTAVFPSNTQDADGNYLYEGDAEGVFMWGLDWIQPIISSSAVSLSGFAAAAFQPGVETRDETAMGGMVGAGGRFFRFIPYVFQIRFLGENFIPVYFNSSYDLYRADRYAVVSGRVNTDAMVGWLASLGVSVLEDRLAFNISVDGPFKAIPQGDITGNSPSEYPHLRASLVMAQGLIPGLYLDAFYDKQYITSFRSLVDPDGATIGGSVNYQTGPAVITLAYDVKYNPATGDFESTAKLMTSIGLF